MGNILEKFSKKSRVAIIVMILVLFNGSELFAQQTGIISGKVVDEKTGEPLVSLNVQIKGTKIGSVSDIDGNYRIAHVKPGDYTLRFSYLGYNTMEIEHVTVNPGQNVKLDLAMQEKSIQTSEVKVTARKINDNGAALLKERQKADAVSDAIGAEEISRGGSGDAADAIKKVTGATTVGGKYVYVRGLGERYSSTQLNGTELPSADPDKKSVHLDLFPAGIIENITTIKTATPDKPGNFTGGAVDIKTKSFPDKFITNFTLSSDYNTNTTGNKMLYSPGSSTDWLGFDNGKRAVPEIVKDNTIPAKTSANKILNKDGSVNQNAILLDEQSKAFSRVFAPSTQMAPVNMGMGFSTGNQFQLFNNQFGFLGSISYSRNYTSFDNGKMGLWSQAGSDSKELTREYFANYVSGTEEVNWGGMLNMAYNLSPLNRLSFTAMYDQNGSSNAVYQDGYNDYYKKNIVTRVLHYVERTMNSYQLSGEHKLQFFLGSSFDWRFSLMDNIQNEPYFRTFDNEYSIDSKTGEVAYKMPTSDNNAYPSIYYRDLNENMKSFSTNLEIPIEKIVGGKLKFKTGYLYDNRHRTFKESRYIYEYGTEDLVYDYNGNPDKFMSEYTGIISQDTNFNKNVIGMYLQDRTQTRGTYYGDQTISATYLMADWYIFDDLRIVGGARYEMTDMSTTSADTALAKGVINQNDVLPSVNLTYILTDNMNLRLAYGKTIARPTFREIAPYDSYLPVQHRKYIGNDSLNRTMIDNYDLRWEWFTRPGEIISVGAFYKKFRDPIETAIISANREIKPVNVGDGLLYGMEFEFRKNLGDYTRILNGFRFGANLTIVHSEVNLPELEYRTRLQFDPKASRTRALQGQSPYVINLDISYVDNDNGWDSNLHYYIFGKRLAEIGDGTPDYYEYPRPDLDFVISKRIFKSLKMKFSAKNILDSRHYVASSFLGKDYVEQEYRLGRSVSLGLTYSIN